MKLVKQMAVWTFILFFATQVRAQVPNCTPLSLGVHTGTIVEASSFNGYHYRLQLTSGTGCFTIATNTRTELPLLAQTAFILRLPISVAIVDSSGGLTSIAMSAP